MIKSTATFLALTAVAVSCGGSEAAPAVDLSPDAQTGAKLAEDQGCMSCHGRNGEGELVRRGRAFTVPRLSWKTARR